MRKENKNNTRIVKMYRYFYPALMPKLQRSEPESPELIETCLVVEEIRIQNKIPVFCLSTQSVLAEKLLTRDC